MENTDRFKMIENNLSTFKVQITSLHNQVKMLDKKIKQENLMKKEDNDGKQLKKVKQKYKKVNYFTKPLKISTELLSFMNKTPEENISRIQATEFIMNYITTNKLANSTIIYPDTKLTKLFSLLPQEEITYFNIHNYIDKLFIQ